MKTPEPPAGMEMELKLELDAAGMEVLGGSDLLADAPITVSQRAIYFDTPDQALLHGGLSLRIRREGDRRVQTVKASGATAGLFVRPEWECDVAHDEPVLDHTSPVRALVGNGADAITPVFIVENQRRQWMIGGIEISLDEGRVIAGDRETTFVEVELEHKSGDPATIFALARKIDASAPVQLGVISKAERGYRLLGPALAASKAHRVALDENMTAASALQAIGFACLRHYRLNVPLVLDHRDTAALHQARVAIRRMRSALTIHKSVFTDRALPRLNAELRWLAAELGKARDIDVLLKRTKEEDVRAQLLEARTAAYDTVEIALQSARARGLMIDLVEWLSMGEWLRDDANAEARTTPVLGLAAETLRKLRKKVKRQGHELEALDDESRHELRKTAKKLRYATEFFAALYDRKRDHRRFKRFLSALEGLQDSLGDLNDLSAASATLRRLGVTSANAEKRAADPKARAALLEQAAEQHDTLIDSKRFWT
ncbi:CHAD domain-containing protein [Novosphingobium kaempferiae]|uniref:CYTH and CHAD domain-containing protein n=1 Tax=Novosphingobium kaempferiae TaxID=2896849 RepID=UPI001E37070F|nr:CHAD domain-containing protein [Novosphingobium kaempferiae]